MSRRVSAFAFFLISITVFRPTLAADDPLVLASTLYPPESFPIGPANFAAGGMAADDRFLAVGVTNEPGASGLQGAGAVYVYSRVAGSWQFTQRLSAPAPLENDYFGRSVAMDGEWLVAAAPRREVTALVGAEDRLEIFRLAGVTWIPHQTIVLPRTGPFGGVSDVVVEGTSLLVGRFRESVLNTEGGVASFVLIDGQWEFRGVIRPLDIEALDGFGVRVSINGERFAAVSQRGNGESMPDIGAAYVFVRDTNGDWTQEAKLDLAGDERWRGGISILGQTVVLGATKQVSGTRFVSAANVYVRGASGWARSAQFGDFATISTDIVWGEFALLSDSVVAVSAPNAWITPVGPVCSAIYVFRRSLAGRWGETDFLTGATNQPCGALGAGLAWVGDSLLATEPLGPGSAIPSDLRGNIRVFAPISALPDLLLSDGFETVAKPGHP
jgi:hypothetical protein